MNNLLAPPGETVENPAAEAIVSDAPAFATPAEQFEYWREQFRELSVLAQSDGVLIVVGLAMVDPIAYATEWNYCTNGDILSALGLLTKMREAML